MEIIDISKYYRFDSVPNPLLLWTDIMETNSANQLNKEDYTEIHALNYHKVNTSKRLNNQLKFDEFLNIYNDSIIQNQEENDVRKRLNKIKVYLIVKSKFVIDKESYILLPINNFENLSNKPVSRLYLHRDGLFEINANSNLYFDNRPPGERRFYLLDELLNTHGAFDSQLDIKIRNAIIETEEDILEKKGLKGKILGNDPNYYTSSEYEIFDYLPEIDPDPEIWREEDKNSMWVQKYGIPKQDYEYDEAEMDNIMFNNSIKYFSGTEKNIFPVFESLEDAEKLLLTIFEDLLEPFRKKRLVLKQDNFLRLSKREQFMFLLPSSYLLNIENLQVYDPVNLDYLDNLDQYETKNGLTTKLNFIKNWLAENRWINSYTKIEPPYLIENYDQNAYITISNTLLLNSILNTKIIEISLGDFYDIWLQRELLKQNIFFKNKINIIIPKKIRTFLPNIYSKKVSGEILFIPKLKTLLSKKEDNLRQFSGYQKFFRKPKNSVQKYSFNYELGKTMYLDEVEKLIKK